MKDAIREAARFARCQRYPMDPEGVRNLATAVQRAAARYSVAMADLVARCLELSSFCPTDHDLLTVAAEMNPPAPPVPWQQPEAAWKCTVCEDTGWISLTRIVRGVKHDFSERCPDCVYKPLPASLVQAKPRSPRDAKLAAAGGDL